jgi:glutathione S-transferase
MPQYKLFYFPAKGAAEPIRLLFAYKGIQYEDIRLSGDGWLEKKPEMPFKVMPVLEEDGKKLGGSTVILRYLGEKPEVGLAGSNLWENSFLANIADFIKDLTMEMIRMRYEKDPQRKKEYEEKFQNESAPKFLGKLNEMAQGTGYLSFGRLTWPDLLLYQRLDHLVSVHPDILKDYPGLIKLKENVENEPNIAKWMKERPKTEF